jgi:SAM-dependent methyltransferase
MIRGLAALHTQALDWVSRHSTHDPITVLDIGGRDINGTCRPLFPNARYTVLDIRDGPNVDIVADAANWIPDRTYDIVVCTETFEHTDVWRDICRTTFRALTTGGRLIVTCAGPGRAVHSAIDGEFRLHDGEHYANITPDDLYTALASAGFVDITVDFLPHPCDTRAIATKPEVDRDASRRQLRVAS